MGYSVVSFVLREAIKVFLIYKISFQTVRFLTRWLITCNTTCFYQTMAFQLLPQTPGSFLSFFYVRDVCMRCALQVEDCPMCRERIESRVLEDHSIPPSPQDTSWQRLIAEGLEIFVSNAEGVCLSKTTLLSYITKKACYIERWLWWLFKWSLNIHAIISRKQTIPIFS